MQKKLALQRTLLWFNCVILIVAICGFAYIAILVSTSASFRIMALDREGVINADKLREAFPALAHNIRLDLGLWVAERERLAALAAAVAAIDIAAVNLLLILLLGRDKKSTAGLSGEEKASMGPGPKILVTALIIALMVCLGVILLMAASFVKVAPPSLNPLA